MKRTDIAYAAGIFDGEGCIRITKNPKRRYAYGLECSLEMANEYIPRLFKFHFGGSAHSKTRIIKGQPYFYCRWAITTHLAATFLEVILPYLKLKYPQAQLGIKFMEGLYPRGGKLSDEVLAVREANFILMKEMKHRQGA